MAVKYAKAMGNEVFVFTTTERKRAAIEELGGK
jgi:D-arabinose 1-dehydrogenase-like Zn-dependent alcohol dehydrogenase